jgi:gliding motility-associated protein GldL
MNIGDFLHSRKWRTIQNYTYSFGASVVLIGALAKLEHWPMASGFLMTGLGMEALIFFISAFEPLVDNPDWKKVYPQLRDVDDLDEKKRIYKETDLKFPHLIGGGGGGGTGGTGGAGTISIKDLPAEQIKKLNESFDKLSKAAEGITEISKASAEANGFVQNLHEASKSLNMVVESNKSISETLNENVKEISTSFKSAAQKINLSSDKVSDGIIQSSAELTTSIKITGDSIKASGEKASQGVAQSFGDLSNSLKITGDNIKASGEKASVTMSQSVNELSGSVKSTAEGLKSTGEKFSSDIKESSKIFGEQLQKSASELNDSYRKIAGSLSGGFNGLEKSSVKYVENIDKLNKNMGALNTAYELHLKGADKVADVVKDYSNSVGEIGKLLHTSVDETRKFNESTKEINENIQALNKVYGRMLGALNNKK